MKEGVVLLGDQDITISPFADGVWFTWNLMSIHLHQNGDGVICDMYPLGQEAQEAIASTYAMWSECDDSEESKGDKEWVPSNSTNLYDLLDDKPTTTCAICGQDWPDTDMTPLGDEGEICIVCAKKNDSVQVESANTDPPTKCEHCSSYYTGDFCPCCPIEE